MKYVVFLVILGFSACSGLQPTGVISPKPSSVPTESSIVKTERAVPNNDPIRSVDFENFTYDWYPANYNLPSTGRKIILKNGTMDTGFGFGKEPREFFLRELKYGDLNGDGKEEAIVVLQIITSGTARPALVFLYTISNNKPIRLWVNETGDRWDFGYHSAYIENGQLLIERYKPFILDYQGEKHNMSSSSIYIRDYYEWHGKSCRKVKSQEVPADPDDKNPWVSHTKS